MTIEEQAIRDVAVEIDDTVSAIREVYWSQRSEEWKNPFWASVIYAVAQRKRVLELEAALREIKEAATSPGVINQHWLNKFVDGVLGGVDGTQG